MIWFTQSRGERRDLCGTAKTGLRHGAGSKIISTVFIKIELSDRTRFGADPLNFNPFIYYC